MEVIAKPFYSSRQLVSEMTALGIPFPHLEIWLIL